MSQTKQTKKIFQGLNWIQHFSSSCFSRPPLFCSFSLSPTLSRHLSLHYICIILLYSNLIKNEFLSKCIAFHVRSPSHTSQNSHYTRCMPLTWSVYFISAIECIDHAPQFRHECKWDGHWHGKQWKGWTHFNWHESTMNLCNVGNGKFGITSPTPNYQRAGYRENCIIWMLFTNCNLKWKAMSMCPLYGFVIYIRQEEPKYLQKRKGEWEAPIDLIESIKNRKPYHLNWSVLHQSKSMRFIFKSIRLLLYPKAKLFGLTRSLMYLYTHRSML